MKRYEQRSIPLPPELWQRLDELAIETFSHAQRGVNFGKPSWRTLFRRIAESEKCYQAIVAVLQEEAAT